MSENPPATDLREPRAKRSRLSLWLIRLTVAEAVLWISYAVLGIVNVPCNDTNCGGFDPLFMFFGIALILAVVIGVLDFLLCVLAFLLGRSRVLASIGGTVLIAQVAIFVVLATRL